MFVYISETFYDTTKIIDFLGFLMTCIDPEVFLLYLVFALKGNIDMYLGFINRCRIMNSYYRSVFAPQSTIGTVEIKT